MNRTGTGKGGDGVIVRISDGHVDGNGQLKTLADGSTTLLTVGVHSVTNHHGAIDADVMFHEYTHGVTDRLVGSRRNPQPLQRPQSCGMSEGWSDYFALSIQNFYLSLESQRFVFGNWFSGIPQGLRLCSYDDKLADLDEARFGALGKGVREDPHDIGTTWCGALMKMNRDLGDALGDRKLGHLLGWQIVIAGMIFTSANPNYLEGRDAIIHALKCRRRSGKLCQDQFEKAYTAVWTAFTRFGLGPKAKSPGSGFEGLEEDTSVQNIPKPNLRILDPLEE